MSSVTRRRLAVAAMIVAFFLSASARADEPDVDRFKAEIDAFIGRLGPSSNGMVQWVGSDTYEIRRDGEGLLATIENARLSLSAAQPGQLTLDSIEVRETARKDDGKLIELALTLPTNMILRETDGTETKITLTGARANTVVETEFGARPGNFCRDRERAPRSAQNRHMGHFRTALDVVEARRRTKWRLERTS